MLMGKKVTRPPTVCNPRLAWERRRLAGGLLEKLAGGPPALTDQSCAIALSSAAYSWFIVASVSSPMFERRNVVPLIFP